LTLTGREGRVKEAVIRRGMVEEEGYASALREDERLKLRTGKTREKVRGGKYADFGKKEKAVGRQQLLKRGGRGGGRSVGRAGERQ